MEQIIKQEKVEQMPPVSRQLLSSIFHPRLALPVFGLLLLLSTMYWAKSRDPFERVEFKLRIPGHGTVRGMAVLPKPVRALPVVIFLHGSGGSLMTDGNELRQFAELGMAAVGMEYDQSNQAGFDEQFVALNNYIKHQSWALSNETAWVGLSLGAQRTLSFVLKHPEIQPQLLVRLSGGWIDELSKVQGPRSKVKEANSEPSSILHPPSSLPLRCPVLLVHGEKDGVFPVEDARRLAELLKAHGVSVVLKIVPDRGHVFDQDRALVTRLVGEYCKAKLTPGQPMPEFPRLHPFLFWACMVPAFMWAGFWFKRKNIEHRTSNIEHRMIKAKGRRSGWEKALRWVAFGLAALAIADTGVHLVPPRLRVNEATLNIARKWLVPPKWKGDFELLAAQPIWQGQRLRTLLEHVELAHYTVNELINWKVDAQIYRDFVLSPVVVAGVEGVNPDTLKRGHRTGEELNWRRALWESFYPRVRHEQTPEAAAEIVVRYLRERVTIAPNFPTAPGVESIWKRQITDEAGFEYIYVAALRSVGIGARLDTNGKAEFWTGDKWASAPRPIISSLSQP